MSRRMPPTPVAAPWYGSMALGWLCDSILNTHASPWPISTAPGVLTRTLQHARTLGGQRAEQRLARLVAAVLAPERSDDPELEPIRLTPERFDKMHVLGCA